MPRKKSRTKKELPIWVVVSTLPRVNSAKLHNENRVYIHPVCALGHNRFVCQTGWKLAGWNSAPWKSILGPNAIVYEKLTSADHFTIDTHGSFEPGLYWGHGDAEKMTFCEKLSKEQEDEIGPWL